MINKLSWTTLFLMCLISLGGNAMAESKFDANSFVDDFTQETKQKATKEIGATKDKGIKKVNRQGMTDAEYRITLIKFVLIITPILLLITLIFLKLNSNNNAYNIVNVTGLVLVIQATMFIVIASPSTEALTAAIGVLGAIIGYLFGSNVKKNEDPAPSTTAGTGTAG